MGVMWELWDKSIRPKWLVWIFHDRLHIHEPEMQNDASFDFNGFKWNGFNVLNTKPKCMYCHKYIYLDENGHWKIL
jgi:hypothetical protein